LSARQGDRRGEIRSLRGGGPRSLKTSHPKKHQGEIMKIAKSPVVTTAPTTPVYDVIRIMSKEEFRRIPVSDPGTKKLLGIVSATDIINYMGGGEKFGIIQKKHSENFYKAIHEPIKEIMTKNVVSASVTARIDDAIGLMTQNKLGGLPVVDEEGRLWGIITERDIVALFTGRISGVKVSSLMSTEPVTAEPDTTILEAEKIMIKKGFRRLPIVSEEKIEGIVTAMDVIKFFGSSRFFQHLQSGTLIQVLQTPLKEIASKNVISTEPDTDVGEAARLMRENNVGALPVVKGKKLLGIITERDFLKILT